MKNKIQMTLFVAMAALVSSGAMANSEQLQVPERVYAPVGFDTNDSTQVVLYGHFMDSCYQTGEATATVQGHEIKIKNMSRRIARGPCMKIIMPWTTTVTLGALKAGNYNVLVMGAPGKWRSFATLKVVSAVTDRPDDYLYANVNGAIVDHSKNSPVLTVSGSFSLTCMEIGEMRTKEEAGVIVVLPIIRIREDMPCGHLFIPVPFLINVELHPKTDLPTLIHIRSANGQALNQVMD